MDSTHPLDLTDEDGVKAWIDAMALAHGGIDILYNNAGATRFSPIAETSFADWSFTIRNELDIVFLATKHAWPHLVARGGGCVLLVGSTAGLTGSLTNIRIAHTASKGGVIAMTRQLAAEGRAWYPRQLHQPGHDRHPGQREHAAGRGPPDARHRPRHPARADRDTGGRRLLRSLPGQRRGLIRHRRQPRRRRRLVRRPARRQLGHSEKGTTVFEYFPGNYVWNLAVVATLNSGGLIDEVDRACRPIKEAAARGEDAGTGEFLRAWSALTDSLVAQAEDAEKAGHARTAGQLYARATNYLCNAERMQGAHAPDRLDTYRRGLELKLKAFPVKDPRLPGWKSPTRGRPCPPTSPGPRPRTRARPR